MKTEHLITRFLKSELSEASKAKLGRLIIIMNSDKEKARGAPLMEALKKDMTIRSIFDHAEVSEQRNTKKLYAGYMDSARVMLEFSISRRTLCKWCKRGVLRSYDFGGRNFFLSKDVENLFLKNYTGAVANTSPKTLKKK